jgi:hypothetical protein
VPEKEAVFVAVVIKIAAHDVPAVVDPAGKTGMRSKYPR